MKQLTSILGRLLISVCALGLVVHNVDFSQLAVALAGIDATHWPALALLAMLSWLLMCWRLQVLFPDRQGVLMRHCSLALGVGVLGNLLLPLRAGDFLRCAVLKHVAPATRVSGIISTLALEKLLELIAVAAILFAWAMVLILPREVGAASMRVVAAALFAVGAVFIAWAMRRRIVGLLEFMASAPGWYGGIARRLLILVEELQLFLNWRRIAAAGLLTALLRLVEASMFFLLAQTANIPLTLPQAFLVMGMIAIATAIPAAPGFLGTYEAAGVLALSLIGIAKVDALAYVLASHMWFIGVWLIIGLISIACLPIPLRGILAQRDSDATTGNGVVTPDSR